MAEAPFSPRPGQVDYTHIRYAPVINCVIVRVEDGKVLLVQRDSGMRLYPGFWNGVSGFLDDNKSIEEKAYEELNEELKLPRAAVISIHRGTPFVQEASEYQKTWLVVPVRVTIESRDITINWEAQGSGWFSPSEVSKLDLLPGFTGVFEQFFPGLN